MKGIVFTEFLELVEDEFGIGTVQKIIDECDLKTNGVYTAVGTYDHKEMFKMVAKLSEIQDVEIPTLLQYYGKYFFGVLSKNYPGFFDKHDLFTFLESIDGYIHPEVLKLYPDAELPSFSASIKSNSEMEMLYKSSRKMVDFAIGLIQGAGEHFKQKVEVEILSVKNDGEEVNLKVTHLE